MNQFVTTESNNNFLKVYTKQNKSNYSLDKFTSNLAL